MGEVVNLSIDTLNHVPVNKVVGGAEEHLKEAIVIGWDNDGQLYFAASVVSKYEILWLIEQAKAMLLRQ
jgi:hypothetical protein